MKAWIRENWNFVAEIVFFAALLACALLHRRPQPAVDLHETRQEEKHADVDTQKHEVVGPVDVKRRWTLYGPQGAPKLPAVPGALPSSAASPAGAPCPVVAVLDEEEHRGPATTDTHVVDRQDEKVAERLDLKLDPGRPVWQVQIGVEDLLVDRGPRFAFRRRVFGLGPCEEIWLEGSVRPRLEAPLKSEIGVAVACAFGR